MIIFSWLVSLTILIFPFFYTDGYILERESRFCMLTTKTFSTSMFAIVLGFLAPLIIVIVIYAIIFHHARQSTRRVTGFAATTITNRSIQSILLPNFKREMTIMRNMLIQIGIFTCGGIPYFVLVLWNLTQYRPPKAFYLLAITCISFSTSLEMITLLLMNKELRQYAIKYLRKLY